MVDVVVLGAHGSGGNMVHVDHVPVPGESIIATDFKVYRDGGKGGHQALVVGKLGGRSAFIGKLNIGPRSEAARGWLVENGVDVTQLIREGEESPHAGLIMIDKEKVSTIVSVPGWRLTLELSEIEAPIRSFAGAGWFVTGFEIPVSTALAAARLAKSLGMRTLLNPSPIATEELGKLDYIDLIVPNEAEAKALAGVDTRAPTGAEKLASILRRRYGVGTVVLTLGSQGAYATDGSREWRMPGVAIEAANTTGAGDMFTGTLVWALAEGRSMVEALTYANVAAAISVTREGTIDSFPTLAEIEQKLSEQ